MEQCMARNGFMAAGLPHGSVATFQLLNCFQLWPLSKFGVIHGRTKVCVFFTDNEALVHVINKQTSYEPHIMALIRRMVLACLSLNINFMARHVPGRVNILADKLSRGQIDEFRLLVPWVNTWPIQLISFYLVERSRSLVSG